MLVEKRWQALPVLQLGFLVLLSLIGGVLLSEIVAHLAGTRLDPNQTTLLKLVILILSFQGLAVVWTHFFLKQHDVTWGEGFGFRRGNHWECLITALIALPVVLVGVAILSKGSEWVLLRLYDQLHWSWLKPELQPAVRLLQGDWPASLILVQGLAALVIAPFAEEILFRGVLYTALKQRSGKFLAVSVTSVLFGLIHFYPMGFLSFVFLAVMLAVLYERTQNLLASFLLHALFNSVSFIIVVSHPKWAEELIKP